ncbi:MAG: acyl--CoA ligase [Aquiluna sp.]|nr:acyl--CoA ligase [Aquiluna sp.]MCF8546178.1 acyl--CoA ligase [Aquiluna sp.]
MAIAQGPRGLFGILERACQVSPDSKALVSARMTFSYQELLNSSIIFAKFLRGLGLTKGDRFWAALPAELSVIMNFAAAHEGLVMVPHVPSYKNPERLGCKRLITQQVMDVFYPIEPTAMTQERLAELASDGEVLDFRGDDSGDEIYRAFFTSGTTGTPKPVALSLNQLIRRSQNLREIAGIGPKHLTLLSPDIQLGSHTMLSNVIHGETFFQAQAGVDGATLISNFQIESLLTSPATLAELLSTEKGRASLKNLSRIQLTGSMLTKEQLVALRKEFDGELEVQFGSAESGAVAVQKVGRTVSKSLGQVCSWAEIQVVDDQALELTDGEIGHIRIKSRDIVQNYFDDQSDSPLKDGWFYGGDLGLVTSNGEIFITGRSSERINVGGVKLSPEDVESLIREHYPFDDLAVFGTKDKQGVPVVGLAFVASQKPDVESLHRKLRQELGARAPTAIFRVHKIPRNELGKVMRLELTQAFEKSIS